MAETWTYPRLQLYRASVAAGVGSMMITNEVRLLSLRWSPREHQNVKGKQKKGNMPR